MTLDQLRQWLDTYEELSGDHPVSINVGVKADNIAVVMTNHCVYFEGWKGQEQRELSDLFEDEPDLFHQDLFH